MAVGALAFAGKRQGKRGCREVSASFFVASRLSKGAGLSVYRGKTQKEKV